MPAHERQTEIGIRVHAGRAGEARLRAAAGGDDAAPHRGARPLPSQSRAREKVVGLDPPSVDVLVDAIEKRAAEAPEVIHDRRIAAAAGHARVPP